MKQIKFLIIALLGIAMFACGPTSKDRNRIINQYHNATSFYKYHVVYKSTYGTVDSTDYYFAAFDKYEIARLADPYLEDLSKDYKILSVVPEEIIFSTYQQYGRSNR